MNDTEPIFIGGDGRSGTTLAGVMLDSHPEVVVLPELHFTGPVDLGPSVLEVLQMLQMGDSRVTTAGYKENPQYKAPVQFVRRCERAGVSREALEQDIATAREARGSDLVEFSDRAALVEILGLRRAEEEGKRKWGLKIMKQIRQAESYASVWPRSAFLHVVRDGRDVAASQILDHDWGYSTIEKAIQGWCGLLGSVRKLEQRGERIWSVRYEDIVERPEAALRQFLEAVGLPWDERMLEFYEIEHALARSQVAHPSRDGLRQPLNSGSVGRHVRDMPTPWVRKFTLEAGGYLEAWGYPSLPQVEVRFGEGDFGCEGSRDCRTRIARAHKRLGGRYLSYGEPQPKQVRAAWLNVEGVQYNDFFAVIKKMSKGVQEIRKAQREGIVYHQFDRRTFLPDIVEVNQSKEYRAAGRMREEYMKGVEELGGYPEQYHVPKGPSCARHNDIWWGAFVPKEGYRQGEVQTDEKLVAYINFRSYGDFGFYNLILGHGDYMQYGVVLGLHLEVIGWLTGREDDVSAGIRTVVYAGYFQGSEGLQGWKKKAGFAPGYLVVADP